MCLRENTNTTSVTSKQNKTKTYSYLVLMYRKNILYIKFLEMLLLFSLTKRNYKTIINMFLEILFRAGEIA